MPRENPPDYEWLDRFRRAREESTPRKIKRLRSLDELPPVYINLPENAEDTVIPTIDIDVRAPRPRPLIHHQRRNYIQEGPLMRRDNDNRPWTDLPEWLKTDPRKTLEDALTGSDEFFDRNRTLEVLKKGHYVLPKDTRSRPRHNPQETVNMVKRSLLKTEKGRNLLRLGRDIVQPAGYPNYKPTNREVERGENQILLEEGYLNKRLVDPKTHDARRRVRLRKHQRELPYKDAKGNILWGTDMDIPEEDWNKKMRKDRDEVNIPKISWRSRDNRDKPYITPLQPTGLDYLKGELRQKGVLK